MPQFPPVVIATNNGDIGGAEVMLQRIVEALRRVDVDVTVVAPEEPGEMAAVAQTSGCRTVVLPAHGRKQWMLQLRRWDAAHRDGLLWCNGLVPATATAGHRDRIVHLHQLPASIGHRAASALARAGALTTLVPSEWMQRHMPGTRVLLNWTQPQHAARRVRGTGEPFTIGFLGRLSPDKGVPVLAEALQLLDADEPGGYHLVVGGEPLFTGTSARRRTEAALRSAAPLIDRRGWVRPTDLFDDIDVLAVPSVQPESFGLVAAEAMAARVPVIVSDAGALPEVVGSEASVVPRRDAGALAAAIRSLAHADAPPGTDAAFTRWQRLFSPAAGAAAVQALLSDLTGA